MRLAILTLAFSLAATLTAAPKKPAAPKVVKAKAPKAPPKARGGKAIATRVPAQTWRNRQVAPTKDRYREIQQALYEQGYLPAEPTGVWNPESVEALKQFQSDQKLSVTGRISSLTLINLGLGPIHPSSENPIPSVQ
jgi:peptidoglycan hydrolase-like protein with peptidoglycan-binding domain